MPIQAINDLDYHYIHQGSGPPLLLLHGFTGSGRSWAPVLPALTRRNSVLTIDLPGHGRTGPVAPGRYAMPTVAADLARFIVEVVGAPANLLGYSMGGRLALYLAIHNPAVVSALILESASPGLRTPEERAARSAQDERLAARIEGEGVPAFAEFWEQLPLFATQKSLPPSVRAEQRRGRLQNDPTGLAGSLRGMGTGVQPNLWPQLADLSPPVLLVAGELDEKFAGIAREMQQAVPAAGLRLMPGCGHTVHLESPDLYVATVQEWLDGVGPGYTAARSDC